MCSRQLELAANKVYEAGRGELGKDRACKNESLRNQQIENAN
jgi:hypothetical protein